MIVLQAAALLALSAHAHAFDVNVLNRCEKDLVLAMVSPSGLSTTTLAPGGTTTRSVSGGSVVFKSGTGAQATRTFLFNVVGLICVVCKMAHCVYLLLF